MRPQSVVLVLFLYAGPVLFTVQRYEEQHRNERKQHTDDGDLLALFTSVLTNTTRDTNTLFLLSYLGPNGNSATGVTSRCVAFEHHFKSHPKKSSNLHRKALPSRSPLPFLCVSPDPGVHHKKIICKTTPCLFAFLFFIHQSK